MGQQRLVLPRQSRSLSKFPRCAYRRDIFSTCCGLYSSPHSWEPSVFVVYRVVSNCLHLWQACSLLQHLRSIVLLQLQRNDMQLPQQTRYTGMMDAFRTIVKEEKWHSLFKVISSHLIPCTVTLLPYGPNPVGFHAVAPALTLSLTLQHASL
jgi:hypothetical protein